MPKLIYQDSTGVERSIVLGTEPLLIGRSAECQVQTQDAMVSRRHARIFWDGGYLIEDLGSSNGVYVGQDKVQKAPFRPGDIVTCGSLVIRMVPDMRQPTSSLAAASLAESNVHNERTPPPAHLQAAPPMAPAMPPPVSVPQPTMAVPAVSAPSLPQTSSPSVSTGRVMGDPQDLVQERARREQAEQALLLAAKKTEEYEGKIDKLKVHIEQLTAEVRREKRNAEDSLAQERNSRGMVEAERDQLRRRMLEMESHPAFAQTGSMGSSQELEQLRLENERLTRELRRAQASQGGGAEVEQQLAQLRNQLVRTELDRDQALRQLSQQSRGGGGSAPDPAAADAAIALNDALVDLRSSLHAATDEATMLTAPADSVGLVRDSLRSATEQLEAARVQLRVIGKSLGVA